MKVTKQETLYHEDHGATLKHKCGKRIVTLSLLSFSLIFLGLLFFYGLFFFVRSLIPTCGGIIVSIILSSLGQCSNNDDHHTFIYLQLKNYNSILRTKYDSIWMPPAVYWDDAMNQEWHVWKIMHGSFATNTMSTTWSCNGNMTKVMYVMMMMNGTVESCMAIYLGMAMEMP